jgi:hypothetical protein
MVATAAGTATAAGFEIAFFGDAAKFKGFADVLGNGLLNFLHAFLGVEETAGDGVFQKSVAEAVEIFDFGIGELGAGVLLLLERLAFHHEGVVLAANGVVSGEGIELLPHGANLGFVQDGLAEFAGFGDESGGFDLSFHNLNCYQVLDFVTGFNTPQAGHKCKWQCGGEVSSLKFQVFSWDGGAAVPPYRAVDFRMRW